MKLELSWRQGSKEEHKLLCDLATSAFELLKLTVKPVASVEKKGSGMIGSESKVQTYSIQEPKLQVSEVCYSWSDIDCGGPDGGHSDSRKIMLDVGSARLVGRSSFSPSGDRRFLVAHHDFKLEGYWHDWDFESEGFGSFYEPAGILYGFTHNKLPKWTGVDREKEPIVNSLLDEIVNVSLRKPAKDNRVEWESGNCKVSVEKLHRDQDLYVRLVTPKTEFEARADVVDRLRYGWNLKLQCDTIGEYRENIRLLTAVIEEVVKSEPFVQ